MSVFKADGFAGEVIGASAELIYSVPCGGGSVIRAVSVIFCLVELYRESVVAAVSYTHLDVYKRQQISRWCS